MQNYKAVCGNEEEVWFETQPNEGKKFLQWAKNLGCVWLSKREIDPDEPITTLHYSIRQNGILTKIPLFAWFAKNGQFDNVKRYMFCEFIQGNFVSPKEYWQRKNQNSND